MKKNGTYKLQYTVDKVEEEILVEVKLKQRDSILKPFENVYRGIAYVNGSIYDKVDISHSVNAKYVAEEIGLKLKDELKKKLRLEGKSFREKKEEIR
jgi:hypothetical protein